MKKDPPRLAGRDGIPIQFNSTIFRRRTSVNFDQCPPAGSGVHSWILATANRCRSARLTEDEAERLILARLTRRPSPANEVRTAVMKAYNEKITACKPLRRSTVNRAPVPLDALRFDLDKLKAFAARIIPPQNWRHWLWERSPKRPEAMNAWSFLSHLYSPGEIVLVFDKIESKRPLQIVRVSAPMDCRVPTAIRQGGHGGGIWFLCNPVDGNWHPNPRQNNEESCRSEEAVSSFRYAVLESDQAPMDLWLSFIVQLPLRVAAIYSSGGRSIHCLIRLDAQSKSEWDAIILPLKRQLKVLGADPACLSAVRLTRLPHCRRPEKDNVQKLLYLSPNPPPVALINLPVLQTREATLTRWRQVHPRWNPTMEAFA